MLRNLNSLKKLGCSNPCFSSLKRYCSIKHRADLTVIGAGAAGYTASIKAAQMGMSVICVEKDSTLGGTCVNIGCIPSKSLLHNSLHYYMAKTGGLFEMGIEMDNLQVDLEKMMADKARIVNGLNQDIGHLFEQNNVKVIRGEGKIESSERVVVSGNSQTEVIETRRIIIATGSNFIPFPGIEIDEERIVSSTGALTLKAVPKRLVILGAGIVGIELGTIWSRLGAQVTLIDSHLHAGGIAIDDGMALALQDILMQQCLHFKLNSKVIGVEKNKKSVSITIEDTKAHKTETIKCDVMLISVGRAPHTKNLGLENVGIEKDLRGRIPVNNLYETIVPNIYAIGDCIQGPGLANKARDEAQACIEGIFGKPVNLNYECIPQVVFTHPEVAWVGRTEEDLKNEKIDYEINIYPFHKNSRAFLGNNLEGFVKVLTCKEAKKILGTHIIGPSASEVINEAALAQEYDAVPEDIARVCHAHPTCGKALRDANTRASYRQSVNN